MDDRDFAYILQERGTRLELATNCLEGSDSTTELPPRGFHVTAGLGCVSILFRPGPGASDLR